MGDPAGRHMRIRPALRFAYTFDEGRCKPSPCPARRTIPWGSTYGKPYRDSLAAARKATGEIDAMAAATGEIGGVPAVVLVQDFAFMGGSLGAAAGEAFLGGGRGGGEAAGPLVVFTASGGARMQEGSALADADGAHHRGGPAPARGAAALRRRAHRSDYRRRHRLLRDAGRHPVGGARRADRFRGPARDRGNHPRDTAAGFQTAEFQVEHGMVDAVVARKDLPAVLGTLLRMLMQSRGRAAA